MRKILLGSLCLALGGLAARGLAGDIQWRPAAARPMAAPAAVPSSSAAVPAASLGRPVAASLGRPSPLGAEPPRIPAGILDRQLTPAGFNTQPPVVRGQDDGIARPLPPGPALDPHYTPVASATPIGQPPPPDPVTSMQIGSAVPGSPYEMYNNGVVADPAIGGGPPPVCCEPVPGGCDAGGIGGARSDTGVFGLLGNFQWFKSDHCFDQMISPLSNPFLFEDPRALTEIRPIYIYQRMADPNAFMNRGNINWFGTQARVALTDRWSIVMNKLGGIDFDPGTPNALFPGGTSFSEFWIGPKYTFIRSEQTGTLAALGLTFQIPTGSNGAFQSTGDLSLTPYLSFAQTFGKSSYGAFNFMATTGFTCSTDNTRTDYFFASLHLDYDIGNLHKIYPLLELNWFHYTRNGGGLPVGFEGRDLINFGNGGISGHDGVSMAAGVRYKFTEWCQAGFGIEFPLSNTKADLLDFRIMLDVIFRY